MNPQLTQHLAAQHRADLMREARQARLAQEAAGVAHSPSGHKLQGVGRRLLALVRRRSTNTEATATATRFVTRAIPR